MCDFGTNYRTEQTGEQLRAIFVETILPALSADDRCKDFVDAVVGIEIVQDTVVFKLNSSPRINGESIGRSLRGLNLSFSLLPRS
jgi:hypothetical protein